MVDDPLLPKFRRVSGKVAIPARDSFAGPEDRSGRPYTGMFTIRVGRRVRVVRPGPLGAILILSTFGGLVAVALILLLGSVILLLPLALLMAVGVPVAAALSRRVGRLRHPGRGVGALTMDSTPALASVLTCPQCGHAKRETMPVDACQFFYECEQCHAVLRPKPGDCCVFCSYGTVKCPPQQSCCR